MKHLILAALLSLVPSSLALANSITLNKDRTVELIGVVNGSAIPLVAEKIHRLAEASSDPIDLLINSPGGSVLAGTSVLDAMHLAQSKGIRIRCVVGVMAASMAFIILSECNEAYALPSSKLLFHPMSLGMISARVQELSIIVDQISKQEERVMNRLREILGLGWKQFHRHYFAETMWDAQDLRSFTNDRFPQLVSRVENAPNLFKLVRGPYDAEDVINYGLPLAVKEMVFNAAKALTEKGTK